MAERGEPVSSPTGGPVEGTAVSHTSRMSKEIESRIEDLKALAGDEGIEASDDSERDLRSFLHSLDFTRRPYLVLLDNGNFRAVWKNDDREQIGLQFQGRGQVQFVLFALRLPDRFMARATGRDTLECVRRQIAAHDLWRLLIS